MLRNIRAPHSESTAMAVGRILTKLRRRRARAAARATLRRWPRRAAAAPSGSWPSTRPARYHKWRDHSFWQGKIRQASMRRRGQASPGIPSLLRSNPDPRSGFSCCNSGDGWQVRRIECEVLLLLLLLRIHEVRRFLYCESSDRSILRRISLPCAHEDVGRRQESSHAWSCARRQAHTSKPPMPVDGSVLSGGIAPKRWLICKPCLRQMRRLGRAALQRRAGVELPGSGVSPIGLHKNHNNERCQDQAAA
mmetsp:Transcript_103960/g.260709  ORF Transcript_103960/g.260709 Transcript_103960/m.260709 type:complete len:250 (+) Transcript_103960:637-1386(+)